MWNWIYYVYYIWFRISKNCPFFNGVYGFCNKNYECQNYDKILLFYLLINNLILFSDLVLNFDMKRRDQEFWCKALCRCIIMLLLL